MINIKVIELNYSINQHFFDCPHCGVEQEFIGATAVACKGCRKPLPAVSGFFEKNSEKRVRHLIMYHGAEDSK